MSDSYSKFLDEVNDYHRLCKLLNVKPKADDIDYEHFWELKKLPCVYWKQGIYYVDKEKYPEYFI